jgi:hypothetical protein
MQERASHSTCPVQLLAWLIVVITSVEDLVPSVLQEHLPHLRAALDDLHGLGVQVLGQVGGEERGGGRGQLGRLHHHGVTGRQGSRERLHN